MGRGIDELDEGQEREIDSEGVRGLRDEEGAERQTYLWNYAVQIVWNDGHNSLMPYRSFIDGWEETNRNDAALTGATAPV
eukprot:1389948-Amorphochlora_amoeboformis.AAC.2